MYKMMEELGIENKWTFFATIGVSSVLFFPVLPIVWFLLFCHYTD